jgi:hypothetical protein
MKKLTLLLIFFTSGCSDEFVVKDNPIQSNFKKGTVAVVLNRNHISLDASKICGLEDHASYQLIKTNLFTTIKPSRETDSILGENPELLNLINDSIESHGRAWVTGPSITSICQKLDIDSVIIFDIKRTSTEIVPSEVTSHYAAKLYWFDKNNGIIIKKILYSMHTDSMDETEGDDSVMDALSQKFCEAY